MLAHRLQRSSGGPLNLNTKREYQERKKKGNGLSRKKNISDNKKKLWACSIEFCLQSKAVDIPSLASFGDGDTRK